MATEKITAQIFQNMIAGGANRLAEHVEEINDLNVFPIPDGDTGINMSMTMNGGAVKNTSDATRLEDVAKRIADGMLMGARGNSGVILSQFFAGIADGLGGLEEAGVEDLAKAFESGVRRAYSAVLTPVEGTILTVMREATEKASKTNVATAEEYFLTFITEARRSLQKTPELLIDLRKAGVVDSGGAGLLCIAEGMYRALGEGKAVELNIQNNQQGAAHDVDVDLFTEDSVLEFGYCTEVLIRLQTIKVGDVKAFDESVIKDYLLTIGNSIVCFKTGSIVKIHVHTMEPYKVLQFCQQYGEFLTLKIENMNLQHNEVIERDTFAPMMKRPEEERKRFAVVAVASGSGIVKQFREFGANFVIEGGQTMNPSSEDFINAFDAVNADNIFVLPGNGNIVLAAKQAAGMYKDAKVKVIPAKSIGDSFAVLSMLDFSSNDADEIERLMLEAMEGVVTGEVSQAIHDTQEVKKGDWLGIFGKSIVSADINRPTAVLDMVEKMEPDAHALLIVLRGLDSTEEEANQIVSEIQRKHPFLEVYLNDGMQDIYSYIVIAE